jgi:TetR/AcrR family transcriptional regulator, repressor for neighboring sulfatase
MVLPRRPERSRSSTERKIVNTARQLLADRSYETITTRDVAAAAGCNHGLITLYFGSKLNLFAEVLPGLADSIAERVAGGAQFVDMFTDADVATYWRLLASLLAGGLDPTTQTKLHTPLLDAMAERSVAVSGIDPVEARIIATQVLMMISGFHIFGAAFISELSPNATPDDAAHHIYSTLQLIIRGTRQ